MNFLAPLGKIYGRIMGVRNGLYDRGILRSRSLGSRTISVGNLTAGGTGKTPIVALVARILAENGERVCILTRGYGRANESKRVVVSDGSSVVVDVRIGGDEPVELARRLIGKATVIADADRVAAAAWAEERFGVTAFILDDGYQHRRAKRDLDIVCLDATNPFGGGVIPAGTARERAEGLRRADAVVITRADLVPDLSDLRSQLSVYAPGVPAFTARNRITAVVPLANYLKGALERGLFSLEADWKMLRAAGRADDLVEEVSVLAFCALGNPNNFFVMLEQTFAEKEMEGFFLSVGKAFPDHHFYTQRDIEQLETLAADSGVNAVLTTAKDAVKLGGLHFGLPVFVVETNAFVSEKKEFERLIIGG